MAAFTSHDAQRELGNTAAASDRRETERITCNLPGKCYKITRRARRRMGMRVRDLSVNGIGLVLKQPLERGTILALELPYASKGKAEPSLACVMHSTQRADGQWLIGCFFDRKLTEAELEAFLERGREEE